MMALPHGKSSCTGSKAACLVGTAGAIVQRNPRSSQWDYSHLVEEMETAYGPLSEHATAVAIALRQRVLRLGEALHMLRDEIYGKCESAVLHLKAQGQEICINMFVYELEVCAVLDSGAWRSVMPLCHYNGIHPDVQPSLQPLEKIKLNSDNKVKNVGVVFNQDLSFKSHVKEVSRI